jgi:hypothetical protein
LNLVNNLAKNAAGNTPAEHRSVFVSHASANFKVADEVRQLLEERDVRCWIAPRDIPPSSSYGKEISKAIEECSVTVLLLTEQSNASRAVANEIEMSFSMEKAIIPLRLREIKPSKELAFFVSNVQWVDAYYSPLKSRIDEIVAIVHAVESGRAIPSPAPEKKTLLGRLERFLEHTLRHKMLLAFLAFFVIAGVGVNASMGTAKIQAGVAAERQAIDQDPATLGLIKLSTATDGGADSNGDGVALWASIYLNVRGRSFQDVDVRASVESAPSKTSLINISGLLTPDKGMDAATITFNVPKETTRITMCMTAQHPTLAQPYTAVWSFTLNSNNNEHAVVRDRPPVIIEGKHAACS